jgi:hypothetical protein
MLSCWRRCRILIIESDRTFGQQNGKAVFNWVADTSVFADERRFAWQTEGSEFGGRHERERLQGFGATQ